MTKFENMTTRIVHHRNQSIQISILRNINQLLEEAEHDIKNYRDGVKVMFRSRKLRRTTLTEVWIILEIMRKPNPIIALLYTQIILYITRRKQSVVIKSSCD